MALRMKQWIACLGLAILTSCGDGSVSLGINADSGGLRFILWAGNFNNDLILDADNQRFAFYLDSGCLYNYQTNQRNTSFCISSGGNLIFYQGFRIRIVNIRSMEGTCVAAFVENDTARLIDIRLDGSRREEIHVTPVQAEACIE